MKTIAQYQHEIAEISNLLNDQKSDQAHTSLLDLENEIKLDIRSLEMQYVGRANSAISSQGRASGKEKFDREKRLNDEKVSRLKPYEEILKLVVEKLSSLKKE